MKIRKTIKIEDDFTPIGKCQMICHRKVIMTEQGPVIVCERCKRIVLDNRIQNEDESSQSNYNS